MAPPAATLSAMALFRNRLTRRFSTLGLLSDLALVGTAVGRLAQRQNGSGTRKASPVELALAGGAALRLLQRLRRRRKRRRLVTD